MNSEKYIQFLKDKMAIPQESGFQIDRSELTPSLYPHVKDTVEWMIKGGCRALFSSFGMQKTVTQIETLRLIVKHEGGKALIICPKRVVEEFIFQGKKHMGLTLQYVRNKAEIQTSTSDILVTNYERVRDGDIEPWSSTRITTKMVCLTS